MFSKIRGKDEKDGKDGTGQRGGVDGKDNGHTSITASLMLNAMASGIPPPLHECPEYYEEMHHDYADG